MLEQPHWAYNKIAHVISWRQTDGWYDWSVAWNPATDYAIVHNSRDLGIPSLPSNWTFL